MTAVAFADGIDGPARKTETGAASEITIRTVQVPSVWARESVEKAQEWGIAEAGKEYSYSDPITRAEFCEFIYNFLNICADLSSETDVFNRAENALSGYENPFSDTDDEKITTLNAVGIINGKSKSEFAPEDYLTREEAATILYRLVNKVKLSGGTDSQYIIFHDSEEISDWAKEAIQIIYKTGIMNGVGENRFAPRGTYTTEQALVTLVRAGERLGLTDGRNDASASAEFSVTKTVSVNEFYINEALRLVAESGKLAGNKEFISLYTTNEDMTDKILALSTVDFSRPKEIYYLAANREQIIANLEALAKAEGVDLSEMDDVWVEHIMKRFNFSTLASLINGSYGAENLAALTILTNSRGYVMPKDFKNNFALFVQYEGDYSAIVAFSEFGDGVISANMSFVKNGDKDNVFMRIQEITSAVGIDGVEMAKVER
ncbi:MAG: S-layer homology domain-containing protein [Oscillospiraceae bacterium]|nr:S-layer homology domain-containing protein [Oscillospiraceae bacterium]